MAIPGEPGLRGDADLSETQSGKTKIMKKYKYNLSSGINPSPEFAKKALAQYASNVGLRCGHDCTYCSSRLGFDGWLGEQYSRKTLADSSKLALRFES
jgi:hypothetical protein